MSEEIGQKPTKRPPYRVVKTLLVKVFPPQGAPLIEVIDVYDPYQRACWLYNSKHFLTSVLEQREEEILPELVSLHYKRIAEVSVQARELYLGMEAESLQG